MTKCVEERVSSGSKQHCYGLGERFLSRLPYHFLLLEKDLTEDMTVSNADGDRYARHCHDPKK